MFTNSENAFNARTSGEKAATAEFSVTRRLNPSFDSLFRVLLCVLVFEIGVGCYRDGMTYRLFISNFYVLFREVLCCAGLIAAVSREFD